MTKQRESGIALIGVLLILLLLGALLEGYVVTVNSDQKLIGTDRQQNQAFYGALAGLEQLTADLGTLFFSNYAPSTAEIDALEQDAPAIENIAYLSPGGGSGYQIAYQVDGNGRPASETRTIPSGPYGGLIGLVTPYSMVVTARSNDGAEVRLSRSLQTVAVPVFQFGIFSETDLSFFAGVNFNFGGRVHTNGNLFLAEGSGVTLTCSDRITAVGEAIRTNLSNGQSTSSNWSGNVRVATTPGAYRNLALGEGSLVGTLGSALNDPTWTNLSIGTYNGYIRNGRTGATAMNLPLVSEGATPIDLIRRPAANEDVSNPNVLDQRYFSLASLRILLSDTQADITSLPTVTADAPLLLAGTAPNGTSYAASTTTDTDFKSANNTPLIGGYIKIEMQDNARDWHDVTNEVLGLGVAGRDLPGTTSGSSNCSDQPDALIRVQRYKDGSSSCGATTATRFWPNVLYDTREALYRNTASTSLYEAYLGGVMHYIELDVNNLSRWFRGEIGASGSDAINETGYVVYFSDRRTNRNASSEETGEYGLEDIINPSDVNGGLPNGVLDTGEDVNANGALDLYGKDPISAMNSPLDGSARPWTYSGVTAGIARKNRPIFFRRALKLIDGASINLGTDGLVPYGLTVASENPVYVQGNYNSTGGTFSGDHVAAAVIADAVTLLSNSWNDRFSFNCPHSLSSSCNSKPGRIASDTWYRTAIIAGKGMSFPHPGSPLYADFGTDGGVHNFLRYLENWNSMALNYRGSIVSLYYSRQGVGTYKYGNSNNVYQPPTRGYNFDTEFLDPSYLPPRTPMFRDVNITGFTRTLAPTE